MIATMLLLLLLLGFYPALGALIYFCQGVIARRRPSRASRYRVQWERASGEIVTRARELRFTRNESMASYMLVAVVIGLVIYLFYAVINPEKF